MAGSNYERQSSLTNGITINASLFNSEFNQLLNAFRYSSTDSAATGHRHDGAAGQGANIYRVGDTDFKNKIEVDETNNRHGFFVEVGAAAVEQVRIQDGAVVPVTTNDIDLGSSSLEFKNIYARNFVSSTGVNVNGGLTVALNTNLTVGTTLTMSSDGTDTTINEIGDGKLLVGANEYIFRTSDGSTSAVDATPTELNRMVLSSGDTGGVFIYGGNASPVATDTGYTNHTAAFYNNGGLALSSPASISNGGWFSCQNSITITDVDGGTESFPDIHLKRNSPSPADADNLGSIEFWGNRTGGTTAASKYGQVRAQIENVSTGVGKIVLLPHDGTGAINAVGFSMGTFEYSGVDGAATNTKAGGVLRLTSADDTTLELSALDTNVFLMSGGLDVTGDVAATTVTVGDGASTDLKLYKDVNNNCFIEQRGTGGLDVSGIYGKLSNESNQELISWDIDNAALSWRGASGAGLKLFTKETGIGVTGTVECDNVQLASAGKIVGLGDVKINPATGDDVVLTDSLGFARIKSNETSALLYYGANAGATAEKLQTTNTGIDVTGNMTASGGIKVGGSNVMTGVSTDLSSAATSTSLASALAIKTYVDTQVGGKDTLAEILATGNSTGGTNIAVDDTDRISFGASSDFNIYHASGFNYILATAATPSLNIGASSGGSISLMNAGAAAVIVDGDGLKTNSGVISSQAGHNVNVQAAVGYGVRLTSSGGVSRFYATETQAQLFYGASAAAGTKKLETTDTGINVTGVIDCDTSLQIRTSATADDDAMPDIYLDNQHVPADGQNLAMIQFRGLNDAATPTTEGYATIYAQQVDVSDGAEKGKLVFQARNGAGYVEALQVTKDGIDVIGTVAASNGLTADYIDLTGGESTTTTGTVACKMIVLNDPTSTNDGNDGTDASSIFTEGSGATSSLVISQADDVADKIKLRVGSAGTLVDALTASTDGIDVTGDLDVTGTITSNAFAHSKALVVETGSLSTSEFLAHAGKRIVKTGATTSVYSLPQPVAADIGKTWIIANASGTKATIDHDASGTAQNIWILDGVTLTAKEADWELKKGSITEIACVAAEAAGGSAAAANYIIYGAGVIEV
tara:strand:+ start:5409 stop:8690 length:3282 start_codon:yes stop_codon:yes gene_type:complete